VSVTGDPQVAVKFRRSADLFHRGWSLSHPYGGG
jgi:hypothetical protein